MTMQAASAPPPPPYADEPSGQYPVKKSEELDGRITGTLKIQMHPDKQQIEQSKLVHRRTRQRTNVANRQVAKHHEEYTNEEYVDESDTDNSKKQEARKQGKLLAKELREKLNQVLLQEYNLPSGINSDRESEAERLPSGKGCSDSEMSGREEDEVSGPLARSTPADCERAAVRQRLEQLERELKE